MFWGVVKCKPKWLALKSVDDFGGMSKRSKTSYAHIRGIDLNNEDPYEVTPRPMGRDIAKRKLKGGQVHQAKWRRYGPTSRVG